MLFLFSYSISVIPHPNQTLVKIKYCIYVWLILLERQRNQKQLYLLCSETSVLKGPIASLVTYLEFSLTKQPTPFKHLLFIRALVVIQNILVFIFTSVSTLALLLIWIDSMVIAWCFKMLKPRPFLSDILYSWCQIISK